MANNINANVLAQFITKVAGADKLTQKTAQALGITQDEYKDANLDENNYLDIDEIINDDNLYEKFAVMYEENKAEDTKEFDNDKEAGQKVQSKKQAK